MIRPKIFISSTCFDLIDLRAELEDELRKLGLNPILSDSITSEFEVSGTSHSIESCLQNVRNCDHYIIILSQRYGPSLLKVGFEDVSATHLEYLEAKKMKKSIYMYVRDQFESEQHLYIRSGKSASVLKFVQAKDCEKMFELYNSHKKLSEKSKESNWFSSFKDSLELKELIRRDLKKISGTAIIAKMVREGNAPLLSVESGSAQKVQGNSSELFISLDIKNYGATPALDPVMQIDVCDAEKINEFTVVPRIDNIFKENSISQGHNKKFQFSFKVPDAQKKSTVISFACEICYSTIDGHLLVDVIFILFQWKSETEITSSGCLTRFKAKKYRNSEGYLISAMNH